MVPLPMVVPRGHGSGLAASLMTKRIPTRNSVNNGNPSTPSRNPLSGGINDTALRWLFYSADFPLLFIVAI
nr:hypothetical protein Iba_chr14dCG1490 [Ipomoea batatas]